MTVQIMVAGADRTPVAEYRELSARDGATTELQERRDDYTSSLGDSFRASRRQSLAQLLPQPFLRYER